MPILATGFITLLLVFYTGYALRGRACSTVSSMISHSFFYSMLISWLIFLLSYWFDLSTYPLAGLIILLTGVSLWAGKSQKLKIRQRKTKKELLFDLAIYILAIIILILIYFYLQQFYNPVFIFWDAVASYNRWAMELAAGEYNVGGAAYPILYPGLWSIIYRLQADPNFWLITKTTLLAAPLVLFFYTLTLSLEKRSFFPILFLLVCLSIIVARTPYFLSGMMDIAIVVIGVFSCLLIWDENNENNSNDRKPESLSLLAGGVASLVKQAGLAFLLLAVLMKLSKMWHQKVSRKSLFSLILALIIPLSFLFFFLNNNNFSQILGSLKGLQQVAINAAAGTELVPHALQLATNFIPLTWSIPVGILVFAGIVFSASARRLLIIFSLLIATGGFFAWMYFASYDIRNLYWALVLLLFAASLSLETLILKFIQAAQKHNASNNDTTELVSRRWLRPVLISLPLVFILPLLGHSKTELQASNDAARNQAIPAALRPMFEHAPPGQLKNFTVITNVQTLQWAPKLADRIEINLFQGKYRNLENALKKSKATVLLLKKLPDGGGYPNIQKLQKAGLIRQVANNNLYSIYTISRPDKA